MSDMSITMTTKGGNVLLMFSAPIEMASQADEALITFRHDSTDLNILGWSTHPSGGEGSQVSMQYLLTGLSATSHTFKVRWKNGNAGTSHQKGTTIGNRVFNAIEF